ncbi:MAG: hypothetical protein ACYTBJ_19845 [Planctomycetota bacterium]|jgi:hypothetical protein
MTKKRDTITALFIGFSGQDNTLVIPRPYIEFCGGDHLTALLLSQILYWAERTNDPDGWFAKSYTDWEKELCMTEYQVKRAISGDKRRKRIGFILENVGIETKLERSKYYKGAATLHYKVDYEKLTRAIQKHFSGSEVGDIADQTLQPPNNVQIDPPTSLGGTPQQCSDRSTETISETTAKTIKEIAPEAQHEQKLSEHQLMVGAISRALGIDPDYLTGKRAGTIGSASKEIRKAKGKPDQMEDFVKWLRKKGEADKWSGGITEHAMVKYWPDYATESAPKPPPEEIDFGTKAEWEARRDAYHQSDEFKAARNAVLVEAGHAIPED